MANELAAQEIALAAGEKERAELEVTLSLSRMSIAKLKDKLAKAELDAEAHTKTSTLIEAALTKEKENCNRLHRELDEMTGKHSKVSTKLMDAKDAISSLEKEAQFAATQIRGLETKLAATESELQQVRREADASRKAKQAYKDAVNDTLNTKKELRHLGMELLREQANLEEQAAQHSTKAAVRSRREAERKGKSSVDSVLLPADEDLTSKVSVLQRRLIAEKEAAAKVAAALGQKEDEVIKLKKSLELRMEGDVLQQELAHLRAQIQLNDKEQRATKAEVAALQAELTTRDKEGRKRELGVLSILKNENVV